MKYKFEAFWLPFSFILTSGVLILISMVLNRTFCIMGPCLQPYNYGILKILVIQVPLALAILSLFSFYRNFNRWRKIKKVTRANLDNDQIFLIEIKIKNESKLLVLFFVICVISVIIGNLFASGILNLLF